MMTTVSSAKCIGIEALPVTVEVDITPGIGIHLIGLADAAVKESLLRTMTALQSIGFRIPGKKIVINLAPADMHKKGSGYDIPIALGIMAASGQLDLSGERQYMVMGELGLDASVRSVPGALPVVELASRMGMSGCILPEESAIEAIEYPGIPVFGVRTMLEVVRIVSGQDDCSDLLVRNRVHEIPPDMDRNSDDVMDFAEIYGQDAAKRGLEIAAAGGHNVLLIGPPGSGKSSLARATSMILPPMSNREAMETSKIYSVAGKGDLRHGLIRKRPFRSPHHSSSIAAMIGGGTDNILPGEISLAHNGILFIDEFCEAGKLMTEALRGPLEDRKVSISRLRSKIEYPASFMLIAATNPCPCGYFGDGDRCRCTPAKRHSYLSKLSGPVMDRIDIHLWLNTVESSKIINREKEEPSAEIAERVLKAREIQKRRFSDDGIFTNAEMSGKLTDIHCRLDNMCREFLEKTIRMNGLSARACTRILKLARTIADLEGCPDIMLSHLSEAGRYRLLDKKDAIV